MSSHATTDLMTLEAVATALDVHKTTVEDWVRDKTLPSFKVGKIRRVSREDLTRFVLMNTLQAKRPGWLTVAVETDFRNSLRLMVKEEVEMLKWLVEQKHATEQRKAAA